MKTKVKMLEDLAFAGAAANLSRDGAVKPVILLLTNTGDFKVLDVSAFLEAGETGKNELAELMRTIFDETPVDCYALITEAWAVTLAENEISPTVSPSKHPDRVEIVHVLIRDRHSAQSYGYAHRIIRDENGAHLERGEGADISGGRFVPPPSTMH